MHRQSKIVYLVRHGESEGNASRIHQSPDTPLSEIGMGQARMLAVRCKKLQLEALLASPYTRAQQTAQVIAGATGLEIETTTVFRERKGPSELQGISGLSQESKAVRTELKTHLLDEDGLWRYSDEENAQEFVERAQEALALLQQRPEKQLLVVSHALNIRMILAQVLDQMGNLAHLYEIYENFDLHNTGLSAIFFDPDHQRWQMLCINDHSHLG